MNIFQNISNNEFTNSEKIIVKYILQHPEDIIKMDLTTLAKTVYVSPATVSRFIQKLGFNKFNEFLVCFARDYRGSNVLYEKIDYNLPISQSMTLDEIVQTVGKIQHNAIDESLNILDESSLLKACEIIASSEVIDIYGTFSYLPVISNFKYDMARIGKTVNILNEVGEQRFTALRSDERHCSIIITYSGKNPYLKEIFDFLKGSNSHIIVVTSLINNKYEDANPDVLLYLCSKQQSPMTFTNIASRISLLLIFDTIFAYLFHLDYEKNLEYIEKINHKIT